MSRGPFKRIPAVTTVAVALLISILATGCQEDRSNLLPPESAERIDAQIEKIRNRVVDGLCFEALTAAQGIEDEIDRLGPSVDENLLRTLRDGVTQLQITIQDECVEAGATTVEPPVEEADPIEESAPPTGGPTSPPEDETGGGGQQRPDPAPDPAPAPEPAPVPEPAPEPTPPQDDSGGNSGGVSPSSFGGRTDG